MANCRVDIIVIVIRLRALWNNTVCVLTIVFMGGHLMHDPEHAFTKMHKHVGTQCHRYLCD